jgi:hypothetical protein
MTAEIVFISFTHTVVEIVAHERGEEVMGTINFSLSTTQ